MTKFEQTNTYQELLQKPSDNVTIAYHISTGIMVTDENLSTLIGQELAHYNAKIVEFKKYIPTFESDPNLEQIITDRITSFLGRELCIVEYVQFAASGMLQAVAEVEQREDFVEWLVR
jgi:hypothetical protein